MLLLFIRVNLRFYRSMKGAVAVGGIASPIPVMLVTKNISPCLAGFIKPRILMPGHVLASPELTDMVLLHELTHYRHQDHLFTVFRSLLLILWWWNPLCWVMVHLSQVDCEAACDEGVIRRMTLAQRKDYGKSLVALLRSQHANPAILFAGTAMSGNKKIIKERITMIANWKQKGHLLTLAAVICLAILVPFLFTSAQSGPLPMTEEAVLARRYANFTGDELLRALRALNLAQGNEGMPISAPWEEAAQKAADALKGKLAELQKEPDPLKWAEADRAALLDILAEQGLIALPENLPTAQKAQLFTDLVSTFESPDDDEAEEETWGDLWVQTYTSPEFRSIKGKVDFKKEWAPKVEELLKSGVPLPENGDLRHLLSLDFQLPAQGSLPEADALAKAKAAILDNKGWKAEELDNFRLWNTAYLLEKDGTPVYWFSFSWDEEKLIAQGSLDALEAKRMNKAYPMVLTVKIDANTGHLYRLVESFDLETPLNRTI